MWHVLNSRALRFSIGQFLAISLAIASITSVNAQEPPSTTCPNPQPVVSNMTAAVINPSTSVTGPVDGTGCDIAVYFGPQTQGTVVNANIFGATSFGIYNNGGQVNVTFSQIHDVLGTGEDCGGESGEDSCDGGSGSGAQRKYMGGKQGTGILFLGNGATGTIRSNSIFNYGRRGISVSGPGASAVIIDNTVNGQLAEPPSEGPSQTGMWIANGGAAVITGNTVINNMATSDELSEEGEAPTSGIMIAGGAGHNQQPNYTTNVSINNNTLTNNDVGILLSNIPVDSSTPTLNQVFNNQISEPPSTVQGQPVAGEAPSIAGIEDVGGNGDRITSNAIFSYTTPIYVAAESATVTVTPRYLVFLPTFR